MSYVGKRVKILATYAGNLEGVVDRTAKVVAHDLDKDLIVLDISAYKKDQTHRYYDYNVIVKADEVEVSQPEFKDAKGNRVEIGDTVAYGPLGGGVSIGKVLDIVEATHTSYGHTRSTVKVQVELDSSTTYFDGERRVELPSKRKQWYEVNYRMVLISKGAMHFLDNTNDRWSILRSV